MKTNEFGKIAPATRRLAALRDLTKEIPKDVEVKFTGKRRVRSRIDDPIAEAMQSIGN